MTKVAIVTDSTSNIPPEKAVGLPIFTIPLHILWEGKEYRDGVDLSPEEFYTRLESAESLPKTSQVTPEEFVAFYRPLLEQGYQILSIHLSARFSGTLNSARIAAEQLGRSSFALIDSMTGSMSTGWHAIQAAKAAVAGATLRECQEIAEKARRCTNIFFIPATLEFLHRGGRIGWAQSFLGSLLQIKPVIETRNGGMEPVDRVRTMARAVQRVIELAQQKIGSQTPIHLAALQANAPELAAGLLQQARERLGADRVVDAFVTGISPVLGTHIGPGAIGLAYMAGEIA